MATLAYLVEPEAQEAVEILAKFFRGLGDPTRLKILQHLVQKERTVSELVNLVGLSQGRVSNHLACLRWCGYVSTRKAGNYIYYSVTDDRVRKILILGWNMMLDNADHLSSCPRISEQ